MQLEWFRTHKKFVYWVLLPAVGGTMAFFGIGMSGSSMFGKSAPRLTYVVGKTEHQMGPLEVIADRTRYSKYFHGGNWQTLDVGHFATQYGNARAAGFEIGHEEMKENLREAVKGQLQMREPSATPEATQEVYDKLLQQIQMSATDFESITHDAQVSGKFQQFERHVHVSDNELFAEYCREKEVVRLRYKQFKSPDYVAKVTPPTEERIKDFYSKNKDSKTEMKDVLYSEPKLSAELIALDGEKYVATLKPEDKDLQAMYDRIKEPTYKVPVAAGTPPPPPEKAYQPFDSVKADVDKRWRDEKKLSVSSELSNIQKELEKAEKDYADAQAKLTDEQRKTSKPFNVAEWVADYKKKKNADFITYWTTPEQTQEQYTKGKAEINATDAQWVKQIFMWSHVPEYMQRSGQDMTQTMEWFKKMFEGFSSPTAIDPTNMGRGYVISRKLKYTDMQLKPVEEAKPAITERLKIQDAIDLAEKDAKKAHDDWDQGNELPAIDTLDEFKGDLESQSKNPLAARYFKSPKPIGEVLPVEQGAAEQPTADKPNPQPHTIFYVGFAVEIQLPTLNTFEKDTKWEREEHRRELAGSYSSSLGAAIKEQTELSCTKIPRDMPEPSLYEHGGGDE